MSNASLATSPAADRSSLSPHVQQALNMLDLDQELEFKRYRQYKIDGQQSANGAIVDAQLEEPFRSQANQPIDMTDDEEDDEDDDEEYEVIPPSQSFAAYPETSDSPTPQLSADYLIAGEMVLTGQIEPEASLDLSFMPPGEIASARDEYLPASQELLRSLGQPPAPSLEKPIPKWKLPVAIGSSLLAIAAVGGMSYVNLHPAMLESIPAIAHLTAPPVLPALPPGQALPGPDLAMGEFSELTLSNINGISLPDADTKVSVAPAAATPSPALPPAAAPISPAVAPSPTRPDSALSLSPTGTTPRLADGLMRNLLPANIQQLAGQSQPLTVNPQTTQPTIKPYSPNQLYYQPPSAAISQPRYVVLTKYVNPLGLAKIQSLIPGATMKGDEIDLGSFPRKSAALATVKKLQEEGVKAWITKQ